MIGWFKPTKAEREEAQRLAERAAYIEHGHKHEQVNGIVMLMITDMALTKTIMTMAITNTIVGNDRYAI